MTIGASENETSYTRIEISAESDEKLEELLNELRQFGATDVEERDAATERVLRSGNPPRRLLFNHQLAYLCAHRWPLA